MGSQPLIHTGRKGSYMTVEPGGTLDIKGNLIGATPFQDYWIDDANGVDTNDGLAFGDAFKTIGKFMTIAAALGTRGRVRGIVAAGGYEEDIVTPLNSEQPFGQLIAWSPTTQSFGGVYLLAATATEPTLTVKARGWGFYGFEIEGPASDGCILLDGSGSNNPAGFELADSILVGLAQADFGIDVIGNGAPYTQIRRVHMSGITGPAIKCSESGTDQPRFWLLDDVTFVDNDDHVAMNPRGFKESRIRHCTFIQVGANRSATLQLDNRGGSNTVVGPGNALSGTYNGASGGYYDGTNDDWLGNFNIAGITTANPA